MANDKTDDRAQPDRDNESQPYAPSWVDRFSVWIDRLPVPSWSFYLGLWLALALVLIAVLWIEGAYPTGTVFPAQLFIPGMIALLVATIPFLDQRADAALTTLQPVLKATEEQQDQIRYELTTLPAVPTLLASLATIAFILLLALIAGERESSIEALAASPVAANLLLFVYYVGWWAFSTFLYHTIHQLRVINRLYTKHVRVSLFAMSPLYAFSTVTALTAVILAIGTYGWTALNPDNLSDPVSIIAISVITILALGVFAWPLLGTRRLLAKEKAERLDEVSLRFETTFAELHARIDDGRLDEVDDLTKVVSLLETERNQLDGISTWPWQPETLRFLMTALLLPLLLWIVQYVLQQVLGS